MSTQTTRRSREQPLNVVLAPGSTAATAYTSSVLAPGFEAEPGLDLRFLGGRTIPTLTFTSVYLGGWDAPERKRLDTALAAAMADPRLNNVLAQYFDGKAPDATFAGSHVLADRLSGTFGKDAVEHTVGEVASRGLLAGLDRSSTVVCLMLPEGVVLADAPAKGGAVTDPDDAADSKHGLGGYHGSVHLADGVVYYAVGVYSAGDNGIVAFDEPWKNVCATFYHELQEARTDPDVEDAIRAGTAPGAERYLGWYSPRGGEIGDIPMAESGGDLSLVMREVPLADGSGTVPIQLMWSNAVHGPEGPVDRPRGPKP